MRSLITLATAVAAYMLPQALAIPAFPGAEGFGANAVGGRGGSVYVVTNLNDSGSGSFRDAVSKSNRIVVFAVGGVIKISSRIVIKDHITIAGQTAPGGGITIYGNGVSYSNAHHTVTRYVRYRMGKSGDSGKDGITIGGYIDPPLSDTSLTWARVADGHDMIFDHVSVSWGRDETFSINGDVSNITISDSIIAQGLETHSCGGLMQSTGGISIIRSLYIDNKTRNPKVKGTNEFVNNVVYNWGGGGGYIAGDSDGASYANIMNNVFISGPSTSARPFTRGNANFHAYVQRNYYDANKNGVLDGSELGQSTDNYSGVDFQAKRYDYPTVKTLLAPLDAYAKVIAGVGASKSRDNVDTQLINQVKSLGKSGALISDEKVSPWNSGGPIAGGTAPKDTDGDGMPDDWEIANGLNPNVNDAMQDKNGDGYANIENYINSLV
ncbi:Pectate lyase [Rhizoctonia solani]|uniref:Probable pectate lyase C n=2 Tax=Rhizoctonia solani TaxID=456999 RepID=A0A8H7M9D8_9AGAM|nr:Pectate lyase [Rhizoctonia solani]KAF8761373.1 Pectate lyase [Rhizoctonia solani]